jgi:hypothetical protein
MKRLWMKLKGIILERWGRAHLSGNFPTPFRKIQMIQCKVEITEQNHIRRSK